MHYYFTLYRGFISNGTANASFYSFVLAIGGSSTYFWKKTIKENPENYKNNINDGFV